MCVISFATKLSGMGIGTLSFIFLFSGMKYQLDYFEKYIYCRPLYK